MSRNKTKNENSKQGYKRNNSYKKDGELAATITDEDIILEGDFQV
ncbi:hypothetical protein Osc1_04920 [Hominimerdicola sp. 21CYCFAH17_S]